jgi:hypothetical protein
VNPYIAGKPVSGTEMFFGRDDVFSFIRRNLIGRHQDNPIVLYGQRRTGKTSVLYQLHRHLDSSYLCIFIDLHGLNLDGMGNLLLGVANSISRGLERDHRISVKVPDRALFLADPRTTFEIAFLEQMWPVLGEHHLVLMMDEVVRLQDEVREGRLEGEIFEYLRHLMQHHTRLNFVFSLGSGLEDMEKEYAFLFNVSLYRRISFLEAAAARDLITNPAQDCYQVTPEAVTKILQITSGHPYYTQLVCHCLFDRWIRSPKPAMTVEDVDAVLTEAIELGSANLKYVWEESTPEEQALMAGMAAAMRTASGPVTVKEIREAWRGVGVSLPERKVAKAIRNLINREVVTGDQTYSFAVYLQRLWLEKHRRLDWVKEELTQALRDWDEQPRFPRLLRHTTAAALAAAVVVILAAGLAWKLTRPVSIRPLPVHPTTAPTKSKASASPGTPTPSASGSNSVAIGPGASHQVGAGQIAAFVESYFAAINNRDYHAYASLFAGNAQLDETKEQFLANYSGTSDSNASLVALASTVGGGRAATVTFDSYQAADISVTDTECTSWRITLYLESKSNTYLILTPPPGYRSSHLPCS